MKQHRLSRGLTGSAAALISVSIPVCGSQAATILVMPGPTSIQSAMAAATPGDSLLLMPGSYFLDDPVGVNKRVTILSQAGPEATIVDLQYNFGSVFYIFPMPSGPTIEGLTIKRGLAAGTGAGSGVYAYQASPILRNNFFYGNAASNIEGKGGLGAAIAIFQGNPIIQHNTLVANESGGGALFLSLCGGAVDHNVIAYNSDGHVNSDDGFGLSCVYSSTDIRDNVFWANLPGQIDPACSIALPTNGNATIDPKFCAPEYGPKGLDADWHLRADSPLAPGNEYAGWGSQLSSCGPTPARPTSWGHVKGIYR